MAGGEPRLGTTATYMRRSDHGATRQSTGIDRLHDRRYIEYQVFSVASVRKWSKFGLIIQRGGRLRCTSSAGSGNAIGTFPGASGAVTITGLGSTWTCSNELIVGNGGNGTLTIANGGNFINNIGFSRIGIGTSGRGSARVTGS